jgi:hypothetical protein
MNLETLRRGLRGDTVQDFHARPQAVPIDSPARGRA